MPKFDRLKGAAKSIRARTEQAKVASEKAKGAAQSAVSQIRDASKGLVDEVTPASRDGLKAASERAKGAAQLAASQIRDTSKGLVDEVTPASRDGLKAASEKVTSSTLSVRSSARKAAGKVSAASTAAGARVRTGSKEAWDAATASAIELVTTTQGLLASSLTSDLNGLMQSMVKGSATIYDKAMDAEYLATHVGGGNHRLFDGGHTIAGAISAGHNASADDGLIQEALGTVQGLLRDGTTAKGLPLANWDKATYDQVAGTLQSKFNIPTEWFYDLNSYDAVELLGGAVGVVALAFNWNRADTETFARLVGGMGVSAAISANPLLLVVTVVALAKAFHKAHQTGEYAEFVDGQLKGGAGAGATLAAVSLVGVVGGPAGAALLAGLAAGVLVNMASKNVSLVQVSQVMAQNVTAAATEARNMAKQQTSRIAAAGLSASG